MKHAVLVLAVALACLIAAPAALAHGRLGCDPGGGSWPSGGATHFRLSGSVAATPVPDNNGGGTLQVSVTHGSCSLNGASSLTVTVADDAQLFSVTGCRRSPIDFSAISQGDQVTLRGTIDDSSGTPVYTATRVCVRVPCFACVGSVDAIPVPDNNGGGTLQVSVTHSSCSLNGASSLTVTVADDAQLFSVTGCQRSPIDFCAISQNDQVALCGTIDDSSGVPVYTAQVVFDCGADPLPAPASQPTSQSVTGGAVGQGHSLKLHLRVSDAMPGCSSADVSVSVVNAKGVKVAGQTVSGVALNKTVAVSLKLHKGLMRGTYRIVTKATDQAGNHQIHAGTALLRVH
jgi:hypothetical protein